MFGTYYSNIAYFFPDLSQKAKYLKIAEKWGLICHYVDDVIKTKKHLLLLNLSFRM